MELLANAFIREQYGTGAAETVCLGGGFYGQVFLARLPTEPHQVVLKIYRFPGLAQREARQLQLLAKYGTVRMPAVYAVRPGDERISCDILSMEYIPGVNAGTRDLVLREECRVRIAQAMIENLLSYHDAVHPEGFGELDDERFASDWRDWYRPKAEEIFEKARLLYDKGVLERPLLLTFEKAMDRFSSIFSLPITTARLIHGDYNTWNILLNEELTEVRAVIDPFHCCWADCEFDLYQLANANGPYYNLLPLYASQRALSDNFAVKNCFYELFTELAHYYDAGVPLEHSNLPREAAELRAEMEKAGIH